ncbi:uncharacterized protein DEA37_0004219 [Paragonimus westermani]|uniref:Uncharacterized protein n=1 Tax=Paragonimus westermani TaxID=34504 RepID=A0A5J4N847_9TREM|nr:uncharacterized protein DEA37_0004219 [Paragonimus westermani]
MNILKTYSCDLYLTVVFLDGCCEVRSNRGEVRFLRFVLSIHQHNMEAHSRLHVFRPEFVLSYNVQIVHYCYCSFLKVLLLFQACAFAFYLSLCILLSPV